MWHDHGYPFVPRLDAKVDDGKPMSLPFDTISLCRSGSWVPPWCDEDWQKFIDACPVTNHTVLQDVSARDWRAAAEQNLGILKAIEEQQPQQLVLQNNSHQEDAQ